MQSGGFDTAMLSFLEIEAECSVNVSALSGRSHVTTGAGGFVDIRAAARHLVFWGFFTVGR
jgi:propionate CoA-transferase